MAWKLFQGSDEKIGLIKVVVVGDVLPERAARGVGSLSLAAVPENAESSHFRRRSCAIMLGPLRPYKATPVETTAITGV